MNISENDRNLLHELFNKCGPLFIALGDEVRQKLILDILDAGEGGINVMTLAAGSKLSRPAISHHLKILKDSGVLAAEKEGTQVFYRIAVHKKFAEVESLIQSTIDIIEKVNKKEGK
ncbi:MAG: winged helix-turn-helix transcriptional regulator [Treponema sp.]|nr:winged helix-turn-helix transcriptional regulator [Candidatus Treponema equi]